MILLFTKSDLMHAYGFTMCVSVFLIKFEVLRVCLEVLDNTRVSKKEFSDVLYWSGSLKRAPSRLSELLRFGYCQEFAEASSSSLERAFMGQTWETSLERALKRSTWVCSLKRGLARLSEHSS